MASAVSRAAVGQVTTSAAVTPLLQVRGLGKDFGPGVAAVQDLDLDLMPGEFVTVLGPSGCGKTTTLRCVAGLEDVSRGVIRRGEVELSRPGHTVRPHERGIGMVFQSYALWPHMTVAENVGYPLRMSGVGRSERTAEVERGLGLVGMSGKTGAYPFELSGGQQQRVALARALVGQPELVLFDEPLSNLDARLRDQMRRTIRGLADELGFAALYVTHDRLEAMVLSDRIVVMRNGRVVQVDTPDELYHRPRSTYAARILGDVNEIAGQVVAVDGTAVTIERDGRRLRGTQHADTSLAVGDTATAMIRVGSVRIEPDGATGENRFPAVVTESTFMGETWQTAVDLVGGSGEPDRFVALSLHRLAQPGAVVTATVGPEDVLVVPGTEA